MKSCVVLDLDNTIIDYRDAYRLIAQEYGLPSHARDRNSIRSLLRRSGPESTDWRRFQAALYTQGLKYARLASGVKDFLSACRDFDVQVHIISHKTATTPSAFGSRDMRGPALRWLTEQQVVPAQVPHSNVRFCDNRFDKVSEIVALTPSLVVDDLVAVLRDERLTSVEAKWLLVQDHVDCLVSGEFTGVGNFEDLTDWWLKCASKK